MLPHHHTLHNDMLLPTIFINLILAELKRKLPDDGRRSKHVGAILSYNVNFSGLQDCYIVHLLVNEGL